MRVTIKDIAREAGLSYSAVSLVLNGRPCRITEENRKLIRETAQRLHYVPNQAARTLVTNRTHMLALILPDIENAFFSSLAKRIEDCCRRDGYALLIANSNDSCDADQELLHRITARGVDGLFLIPSNESFGEKAPSLIRELSDMTTPYVIIDRVHDGLECDKVLFDNERGAYLAVSHLLENGHTRIGCVANTQVNNGRSRLKGYYKALEEAGLPVNPTYIAQGDYHLESGRAAAEQLCKTDVTAVFVTNDMMALGFLKGLFSHGLRVPEDMSLVGYDNALASLLLDVELTSVAQDAQQLGEAACGMLMERLRGERKNSREICMEPTLVVRGSVKRLGGEVL